MSILKQNMMQKISYRQIEVLLLTIPGPLGLGLTQQQAGNVLGISRDAVAKRLERFKKKYPNGWNNVIAIRNTVNRQRQSFEKPLRYMGYQTEVKIVQKF